MRILLVDDDREFCTTTAAVLGRDGHEAVCAFSEAEASALLCHGAHRFEVAVLDMYMENDDSGLRLVKLIADQKLPTVPIILTGHGRVSDAVASMRAGALDYVEKGTPEQVDLLSLAINRVDRFQQARTAAGRAMELVRAAERVASRLQGVFREIDNAVDDLRRISDEVAGLATVDEEPGRDG